MLSASTSVQDEVAAHFRCARDCSQAPNTGFSSHFRGDFLSLDFVIIHHYVTRFWQGG